MNDFRPRPRRWARIAIGVAIAALTAGIAIALALLLIPIGTEAPDAGSTTPMTRDEALAAVERIRAAEAADPIVRDDCITRIHDQGPEADVVVLFHGYTNCPKQFDAFADELVDRGYSVYIPRAPYHGEDPDVRHPLGLLEAADIARYADESMDVAAALGGRTSVLGLSGGGLVASYIAQYRSDADLVVPIAAFLGLPNVPMPLTPMVVNGLAVLPTIDAREAPPDEAVRGAYPHGASDTSAQGATAYMRVADTVLRSAGSEAPAAGRVVAVLNEADDIVNNGMIEELSRRWADHAADRTVIRRLPASLGLLHDLVTPDRDGALPDVAYPILLEALGAR